MTEPTGHSPLRAELGATLRLAAPLAAANLLQMLVHAVDMIFVARLGEEALAASSVSLAVFGLTLWCLSGLTGASGALIASELGRRAHAVREVRRSVRMALWLAVATGLGGMAISAMGETLLLAAGQEPAVAARAGGFMRVLMWAMIPMIAASVLRTFVSALGRPVFATAITALAIVVNLAGNWVFVFGNLGAPALGLEGSALSSVLTSLAMLAAYVAAIRSDRRLRRYRIFGRWWRPEWQRLREIVRLGTPIALTILAEAGLFSGAALLMGWIGAAELAGHAVALQVAALAFQVPFGIGQAATIRVGYHFGAGDRVAAGRAGWVALGLSLSFMLVPAALMLFAPRFVLSLYLDPAAAHNAALVGFAVQYMMVAAAFQLFDGAQAVMAGALRGLQDTRVPMAMALFGYWVVGFAICLWLGFRTPLAGIGVWIGLAAGLVVVAALLTWRWHRREALGLFPA
ncbi:MATE family efflux transporter [Novosphingobium sp.]|uniref:MATE family efflux transporter n=1 Tax=Novosphingobium sp. TaxID=1874826 RepID=UPI001EB38060|nr:MATE family efflux transporter [Novosphingobium sp.]MBK6800093.1 MATE family efflux transporter [Novosphingobium sp.]MBK9010891.1 MATE family efflux transporter [Novosphingobium sp.]